MCAKLRKTYNVIGKENYYEDRFDNSFFSKIICYQTNKLNLLMLKQSKNAAHLCRKFRFYPH